MKQYPRDKVIEFAEYVRANAYLNHDIPGLLTVWMEEEKKQKKQSIKK